MSYPYQPYYCEENIWQLCRQAPFDGEAVEVVVISNRAGACPFWHQRAAPSSTRPIFWDYHVVAIERQADDALAWDLDTRLATPAPFELWWQTTFPALDGLTEAFQPSFRVVPHEVYLETLSSDRSHMRTAEGEFKKPPPDWEPIFEPEVGMNLDRFVDLQTDFVGEVLGLDDFAPPLSDPPSVEALER